MPKDKIELHNSLNINTLPPPIAEGKENNFTYSIHLSKLLRRFVRIAVPDNDQLTISDVELLEQVMHFGNLGVIAKKRHCAVSGLSVRLSKIMDQLEERVTFWEAAQALTLEQQEITHLEDKLQNVSQHITELEEKLQKAQQRRAELDEELKALVKSNGDATRRLTISSARQKSMAVETHLREHK